MQGKFDTALAHLQEALGTAKRFFGETSQEMSGVYSQLGMLYVNVLNQADRAITYFEKQLSINKINKRFLSIAKSYINLAKCHYLKEDYKKQLQCLEEGLKNVQLSKEYSVVVEGVLYFSMGSAYAKMGNFEQSNAYHYRSLELYENGYDANQHNFQSKENLIVGVCAKLGESYLNQNNFKKAHLFLQRFYDICLKQYGKLHVKTIHALGELAKLYEKQGKYETALQYYFENLSSNQKINNKLALMRTYICLANIYRLMRNFEEAEQYAQMSLQLVSKELAAKHISVASVYHLLANIYHDQERFQVAIPFYQRYLLNYFNIDIPLRVYEVPQLDINAHFPTPSILTCIGAIAECFYLSYLNEERIAEKQMAAWQYMELLLDLINQAKQSFRTEGSKLLLSNKIHRFYGLGVEVALSFEGKEKAAFQIVEKSKASTILANMQDDFAKWTANIPADLLDREQQLKIDLTYFNKSIQQQEAKGKNKNEQMIQQWRVQLFDLQKQYTQLIQNFEQNYPNYYQLKYQTETVSVETIQDNLSENQWMVNYFVGETYFYIFLIGKGVFEVLQYEKNNTFEVLVADFLQSIQQHDLAQYETKAYELYQRLLQPVEVYLMDMLAGVDLVEDESDSNDIPQLIVIPHDILHYVPFEALICTRPGRRYDTQITDAEKSKAYQSLDYLLLHCEVSYHYSATLWHYLQKQQQSKNKITGERAAIQQDFVGFAPVYESKGEKASSETLAAAASSVRSWATRSEALRSDGTWTPLPYSKVETEQIAHLFAAKGLSSKTFLHEEATKEQFRETVEQSRFLLIAAHGVVNDERPKLSGLVFFPKTADGGRKTEDGERGTNNELPTTNNQSPITNHESDCILSMEETYHLNLQKTDLVVLSSCESGIGELAKGEGMMAVNRGFLYAGAKNVVSTLFKVYDKPSSLLTQYLFEGILEGKGYSESLRLAKLRLLRLEEVDVKSWCGFVLIGG